MDTNLVEKIVHEVKSQGVFDEFRKDSIADVDTKPAYQNLRQRVENTVKKFLSEQKWTLETNKNQLREKLRRHITESGFLDVGVERIVDQVVNPKIGSVFQPRVEEIAYKYLGLPPPPKHFVPPPPPLMHPLPPLPLNAPPLKVETTSLLPTDLEQVSPDSDNATVKSEGKDDRTTVDMDMDLDEKLIEDEDESPPFEPLVKREQEETKDDIKVEKQKAVSVKQECYGYSNDEENKLEESVDADIKTETMLTNNISNNLAGSFGMESAALDKETSQSVDARISQDSQLSTVSSDSRLSKNPKEDSTLSSSQEAVAVNISEEAQMPKFSENSCELNNRNGNECEKTSPKCELHFDIKKDEIKFEGTERKKVLETIQSTSAKSEEELFLAVDEMHALENQNDSFGFSNNKTGTEEKEEQFDRTPNAQELSFGSSVDDSLSVPPNQISKNSIHKENNESTEIQTPKQITHPTTPAITPPLPTPTPITSPAASHKPDKDNQSRHSYSSSSSRHKKRSKERRKSCEREKDSNERHRSSKESKDSSSYHSSSTKSSGKHSSSSSYSKYSSSRNKNAEKDGDKLSSSAGYSSSKHTKHSSSHSSSSSNEIPDFRKYKRDSDRRHHSSSGPSSKRNESKDDHAEVKNKIQRRKSTDSNEDDGDKNLGDNKPASQYKSSYLSSLAKSSKSNGSENYKSSTPKSNGSQKDEMEPQDHNGKRNGSIQHLSNVVFLNDILENPQTQFIELNHKGHLVEMPVQKQTALAEADTKTSSNNDIEQFPPMEEKESFGTGFLYFDEIQPNITDRLKLLNATMDLCRSAVNSLRFDSLSDEGIELSNDEDVNSDNNKINQLTETLKRTSDFNYNEFDTTPRKCFISNETEGCPSKISPSPSDTSSVNSKENEEIHKNTNDGTKSLLARHKAVQKLSQQQRYSSDDLYKPRPILGQRSRRRGIDSSLV